MAHPQQDPRVAFRERFDALVKASGLSIRDIVKQAGVARSTLDGWKNGRGLPQNHGDLIRVVEVLHAAAGHGGDVQRSQQEWRVLLRAAKEARDAGSSRRPPGGPSRDTDLVTERRARSIAATTVAMEALGGLRDLDAKPDWKHERDSYAGKDSTEPTAAEETAVEMWEQKRDGFLGQIQLAILDIDDPALRARLSGAVRVLKLWRGPMKYTLQSESRTRYLAVTDALEALGAYRRGDPLPDQATEYQSTSDYVDIYLDELEMNAGH